MIFIVCSKCLRNIIIQKCVETKVIMGANIIAESKTVIMDTRNIDEYTLSAARENRDAINHSIIAKQLERWVTTSTHLSSKFGVSHMRICEICRRYKICTLQKIHYTLSMLRAKGNIIVKFTLIMQQCETLSKPFTIVLYRTWLIEYPNKFKPSLRKINTELTFHYTLVFFLAISFSILLQEVDPKEILLGETILRQRQGEWEPSPRSRLHCGRKEP